MKIDLINSLNIDKKEVLRYLQYKGQDIDDNLQNIIHECINITKTKINPRYTFSIYPIKTETNIYEVEIKGTTLKLKGKDIYDLLKDCQECILIAITLGLDVEREIKKYSYTELTKGIIIDSCATTAIEEVCDNIQNKIEVELSKNGKHITNRYSPGYGDLPIETNEEIINILGTQNKIGLTITKDNIMIPRKSVIAIIGISTKQKERSKKSCSACANYHKCKYKREVDNCGN